MARNAIGLGGNSHDWQHTLLANSSLEKVPKHPGCDSDLRGTHYCYCYEFNDNDILPPLDIFQLSLCQI